MTGGGSAGGRSLTGVAGGTKGKEDTIREVGISDVGGGPLHTDTMGAKVTEGPRASKNGAGGESPGEDEFHSIIPNEILNFFTNYCFNLFLISIC